MSADRAGSAGTSSGATPGAPFRPRGGETTRLEGFSDAVFGFALTLLVVSLEAPRTFQELVNALAPACPRRWTLPPRPTHCASVRAFLGGSQ